MRAVRPSNGHALTAVGYYGGSRKLATKPKGDDHLHIAECIDGLIVHNDQVGPYVKLPRAQRDLPNEPNERPGHYTCSDIFGVIIPLPDKVFLRADKAEEYAWLFATLKADEWSNDLLGRSGGHRELASPKRLDPSKLIARTFLTRGYDHYQWLSKVTAHSEILNLAASLHYPRFIWITEFYSMKNGVPDLEHAVAHVVADATAISEATGKLPYNAFMFGHVPGRAFALLTTGRPGAKFAVLDVAHDHPYRSFEMRDRSHERK